jgi:DNA-binding NarL/FixJ family response regulator
MIRVLLVDDHLVMRQLLRSILESYKDLTVVAEAGSGEEAVARATELKPSVVVIDINLPAMNGIEATKLIKLSSPSTAVIGLTAGDHDLGQMLMKAAGAVAVVSKDLALDQLYPAILNAVKPAGSLV